MKNNFQKKKILIILGSTATGKTDLALQIAKKLNGELIACDSRQVYQGLDIGTGKMPSEKSEIIKNKGFWIINGIKVWLYDIADLKNQYTVSDYVKDANLVIEGILNKGKLPIIVGGTGLYLKALVNGLNNLAVPINLELREKLAKLSLKQLQQKLQGVSLEKWEKINSSDRQNPRRLLRSIELIAMNPYTEQKKSIGLDEKYNLLKIGLTAPRQVLNKKVDLRILDWFKLGIIDEVKQLKVNGISSERFENLGLEYKLISEYLDNENLSIDELTKEMEIKLHQYIKRQQTWFKKEKCFWFDITTKTFISEIEKKVRLWYDKDTR